MTALLAKALKRLRTERGISQGQLAEQLIVDRFTINRWESGNRIPNNLMIAGLSRVLDVDINILLNASFESDESPNVILVDDTNRSQGGNPRSGKGLAKRRDRRLHPSVVGP